MCYVQISYGKERIKSFFLKLFIVTWCKLYVLSIFPLVWYCLSPRWFSVLFSFISFLYLLLLLWNSSISKYTTRHTHAHTQSSGIPTLFFSLLFSWRSWISQRLLLLSGYCHVKIEASDPHDPTTREEKIDNTKYRPITKKKKKKRVGNFSPFSSFCVWQLEPIFPRRGILIHLFFFLYFYLKKRTQILSVRIPTYNTSTITCVGVHLKQTLNERVWHDDQNARLSLTIRRSAEAADIIHLCVCVCVCFDKWEMTTRKRERKNTAWTRKDTLFLPLTPEMEHNREQLVTVTFVCVFSTVSSSSPFIFY